MPAEAVPACRAWPAAWGLRPECLAQPKLLVDRVYVAANRPSTKIPNCSAACLCVRHAPMASKTRFSGSDKVSTGSKQRPQRNHSVIAEGFQCEIESARALALNAWPDLRVDRPRANLCWMASMSSCGFDP